MIDIYEIDRAITRLEDEFVNNARNPGTQLVSATSPEAYCYGQHLKSGSAQRGMHGTAAALRVLSGRSDATTQKIYRGLVQYSQNRLNIEATVSDQEQAIDAKRIQLDESNVIKIAEVLHGLANAPTAAGVEAYSQELAERLINGTTSAANAWSYLLKGPDSMASLLPTAWATLALHEHKYDVTKHVSFIKEQLGSQQEAASDITVRVFALYVLTQVDANDKKSQRVWFDNYWAKLAPLLSQDLEANIEYLFGPARVMYVRVPWQLYLIACAARLRPYRAFAHPMVQDRMASILNQVSTRSGLVYPHSGDVPSTRTNSILRDVLLAIRGEMAVKRLPLGPFYLQGKIASFANNPILLLVIRLLAAALVAWTVYQWISSDAFDWSQTAPNLATSLLLWLLTLRKVA